MGSLLTSMPCESRQQRSLAGATERARRRIGTLSVNGRYHTSPRLLEDDYTVNKSHVLGTGLNGGVCMAQRRGSTRVAEHKFAVKSFRLSDLNAKDLNYLRNEIEISLSMDHPNVVRIVDVYESNTHLHLVMDCMEGGELFDRVKEQKGFTESDAAAAAVQMLLAVNYMHSCGLVHRDLKLENFLYEQKGSNVLKLIDFGFSKAWDKQGSNMQESLGTAAYVAPEVLKGSYTSQCDLWSLGVIVFILLSGYMPFKKEEQHLIQEGRYCWKPERWSNVSDMALDFVKKLLTVDPKQRLTAAQALEHPWLANQLSYQERKQSKRVDRSVADALSSFASKPLHNRIFMGLMAWSLEPSQQANLHDTFTRLARKSTGVIHQEDFINALMEFGVPEEDCRIAFKALDVNENNHIDYSEFLAAMTSRLQIDDELLRRTFERVDADHNGFITLDELNEVTSDPEQTRNVMRNVDANFDNQISYPEFVKAVRSDLGEASPGRWWRPPFLTSLLSTSM